MLSLGGFLFLLVFAHEIVGCTREVCLKSLRLFFEEGCFNEAELSFR